MARKLATVQKIVSLDPIPDADRIEKATVLGWEIVTAKTENHKAGDLCVYIEIDSIVPDKPEFQFLKDRNFRVRTIRLKKQISQGLILPLSILPKKNWKEGDDVTDIIGVKKYDPEGEKELKLLEEKAAKSKNKINKFLMKYPWYRKIFGVFIPKKNGFPAFIKKTDEDRIQLFPSICEKEKDTIFTVTEKLDGQSATYFLLKNNKRFLWFGEKYIFGVCSRNLYLPKEDNSSYWKIAKQYNIKKALEKNIANNEFIVLQGEIIGNGIQGNKYGLSGLDFFAFNLIYPDGRGRIGSVDAKYILQEDGIKFVPILNSDIEFRLSPTIPENVERAKGKSVLANCLREGLVIRSVEKNISLKIINPEFLVKYDL